MSEKTSFLFSTRFYVVFLFVVALLLATVVLLGVRTVSAAEPSPSAVSLCKMRWDQPDFQETKRQKKLTLETYNEHCYSGYDNGSVGVCKGVAATTTSEGQVIKNPEKIANDKVLACATGIDSAQQATQRCDSQYRDGTETREAYVERCKADYENAQSQTQDAGDSEPAVDIDTAQVACEKGLALAPEGSNWDPVEFKQYCEAGFSAPGQGICKDVTGALDTTGSKLDIVQNNSAEVGALSDNLKVTACGIGGSYSELQGTSCDDQWADKGQAPEGGEYDAFIKKCRETSDTVATTKDGDSRSCDFMDEDGAKQKGVLRPNSLVCIPESALGSTKPDLTVQGKTDPDKGMGDDLESYVDNSGGKQPIKVTKTKVEGDAPAIVFVHGGGWYSDGGTWNEKIRKRFAKAGFTTFRIKYRLIPGGVIEQREDVMRAVQHISNNADRYGIDKKRLAVMGDSAGGSLATRVASTGRSPAKAVVGWSAPTNAFRDLFNSVDGWVAGLWHSRCFGEYVPDQFVDIANFAQNSSGSFGKLASGKGLSPAESGALLNDSLALGNLAIDDLPATAGKLKKGMNDFGFSLKGTKSDEAKATGSTETSEDTTASSQDEGAPIAADSADEMDPALVESTNEKLKKLTPEDSEQIGQAIATFNQSTADMPGLSEDDIEALGVAKKGLSQLNVAMGALIDEETDTLEAEKAKGGGTDTSDKGGDIAGSLTAVQESAKKNMDIELMDIKSLGNEATLSFNPMSISTEKVGQCINDFVQLSPALVASPRTPPGLFISAEKERWVNQDDTYQMRDKLRSMGIKSDARVLPFSKKNTKQLWPDDGHMGHDARAEKYSIEWLTKHFKVKSEAQQEEERAAAKKAEEDKRAAEAAAKAAEAEKTAGGSFTAPNVPNESIDGRQCRNDQFISNGECADNPPGPDCSKSENKNTPACGGTQCPPGKVLMGPGCAEQPSCPGSQQWNSSAGRCTDVMNPSSGKFVRYRMGLQDCLSKNGTVVGGDSGRDILITCEYFTND